ncbi:hypothetical protein [Parvibaculum sp.]|uniref:hypothetical protein n=1 Tax=Parvibaculum sp. TaxID=2024848 RepID=UPI00329A34BF
MSGITRWWENYLVRYLMPSIAGMLFVAWLYETSPLLQSAGVEKFVAMGTESFGAPHLIFWILLGSLYCYFASYPILVFHATRVLDFTDRNGHSVSLWQSPYAITLVAAVVLSTLVWSGFYVPALLATLLFCVFQGWRIWRSHVQGRFGFKEGYEASIVYAYLNKLAKRRSIQSTEKIASDDEDGSEKTIVNFEADLSDSYRHLREHGNTAFIFVLEIALFPVLYAVLHVQWWENGLPLAVAIVLLVWCGPAMWVHWMGQHLERRFSKFVHRLPSSEPE